MTCDIVCINTFDSFIQISNCAQNPSFTKHAWLCDATYFVYAHFHFRIAQSIFFLLLPQYHQRALTVTQNLRQMITSWRCPYQQTNAVYARVNYESLYWGSRYGLFVTELVQKSHGNTTGESKEDVKTDRVRQRTPQWAQQLW